MAKSVGNKGFQLVWADEFNQKELDTTFWNNEVAKPGWVNNELQQYTNGDNITLRHGKLILEARKEDGKYTSSRVNSSGKKTFTYGLIEIKAKLPQEVGTWPALWMLGQNIDKAGWPACGELDIMEHVGKHPNFIHTSIHNPSGYGETPYTGVLEIKNPFTKFHIYSMNWDKDSISFYVDGRLSYTYNPKEKTEANWPFGKPFFLIFNVAIGGNWGGPTIDDSKLPATMEVDYVRVYQKK
ncbi:MAG: glycoside hydrolase family 16 protein [Bacteroidales bacterium]|nr:glycoside hydrolase family 16 protein [Bacteroidales bacterium]